MSYTFRNLYQLFQHALSKLYLCFKLKNSIALLLLCNYFSFNMTIKKNTSLAAKEALAHCLQRHNACKIQNGRQRAPKWPMVSGKVSIMLNKFFDPSTPSMRKCNSGERRKRSRPPERRLLERRTLVQTCK